MSNDPINPTSEISEDLGSATILAAFDIAVLSYDTYDNSLGKLTIKINKQFVVDPIENVLTAEGWTPIVGIDRQNVPGHSYQGVACCS